MMVLRGFLIVLALSIGMAVPITAGQQVTEAADEARIRDIATKLRCPVCQSENLLDSRAGIAREMLVLVREQVAAGKQDEEIMQFFITRYGEYVALDPARKGIGLVVWLIPLFLAGLALIAFVRIVVSGRATAGMTQPAGIVPLSEDDLEGKQL